jgi:hypothetical protein
MAFLLSFIRLNWKLLLIIAVAGAFWFAVHRWGDTRYASGRADERAPWLIVQANAQKAARAAIQAQIDTANATDKRNAEIIASLNHQVDDAVGDLSVANRLLVAARARTSASHPMPETADQPRATPPGGTPGDGLADSVAAAIGECRRNSRRLDALIAEISPQI